MNKSTKDTLWASFIMVLAIFSIVAMSTDANSKWRNRYHWGEQEEAIVKSIPVPVETMSSHRPLVKG